MLWPGGLRVLCRDRPSTGAFEEDVISPDGYAEPGPLGFAVVGKPEGRRATQDGRRRGWSYRPEASVLPANGCLTRPRGRRPAGGSPPAWWRASGTPPPEAAPAPGGRGRHAGP